MEKEVVVTGVRKGAWTKEEDMLLIKCVQEFGEGRWHLVPLRAGLNRCRKSCRMRWLNYLRPNLKRGNFAEDEVDLILKMHKLLGNRWTLIAGRLPGRTANDVKNFWNSHICKKPSMPKDVTKTHASNLLKPRPRTLTTVMSNFQLFLNNENNIKSKDLSSYSSAPLLFDGDDGDDLHHLNKRLQICSSSPPLMVEGEKVDEEMMGWWRKLLEMSQKGNQNQTYQDELMSSGLFEDFNI